MTEQHTVYLSLGSNVGRRHRTILRAYRLINQQVGHIECQSRFYETEPWGFNSKNKFINSVIRVRTALTPRQLLTTTQAIERQLGRTSKTVGHEYHDRPIDIDILLYDHLSIDEPDLHIPHPAMTIRPFVMTPLQEVMQE